MANNQQSDSNNVNQLAKQLQSTLSDNTNDHHTEQDISKLIQNIQLAAEKTNSSDKLLSDIPELDKSADMNDSEEDDDFDKPLFFEAHPWITFISIVLVIGLIGGGFLFYQHSSRGESNYAAAQIANNVYAAGIQIGGMTQSQAETALAQSIQSFSQKSAVISFHDSSLLLAPEDIAFSLNIKDTVEAAMNITGTSGKRLDMDIQPYVRMNYQQILDRINEFFIEDDSDFVQSSFRLEGIAPALSLELYDSATKAQTLVLNRGIPGPALNTDACFDTFIENYLKGNLKIEVEDQSSALLPDELDLESIYRTLSINPIASRLAEDGETFIPGKLGYTFSMEDAQQALDSAEYGEDIYIPMQLIFPDFEGSPLFPDELGSAMLPCDTSELTRVRFACQAINGKVVKNGIMFSMDRCFETGAVIDDCRSGPPEDHGVCMTASAIFQAALNAGMNSFITTRHNYIVSYTEPAFDIYFSKNSSDFLFLNSSGHPILVLTAFQPDGIYVRILGTEYRDYTIEVNQITEAIRYYTSRPKSVSRTEGYEQGEVIQPGVNGYVGRLELIKRSKKTGEVMSTEVVRNLYYEAVPEIVASVFN